MADEKPGAFTTIQAVSTSATALVVGAAVGSTTPIANSGMAAATITMLSAAAPTVTTNKIYNISGALYFNGLSLATGSTISGTVGTVSKFTGATALGDSNITISGSTVTVTGTLVATTNFSGPGALLTNIPTSAVSSGNFVATVASGTGITSSATSGNAAATTITLNNTAVTPSTYGSTTAMSVFTVDQQGRITNATTATPQLTLTSTYFSSLAATNLTGSSGITGLGTVTSGVWNAGAITSTGPIIVSTTGAGRLLIGETSVLSAASIEVARAGDASIGFVDTTAGGSTATESAAAAYAQTSTNVVTKIGALAWNWTDKTNADGYAAANIHSSYMVAGVQTDYTWIAGWGNKGVAFFPPNMLAATAPGAGVVKIYGDTANHAVLALSTSDASKAVVVGVSSGVGYIATETATALTFLTAGTERMRFLSGGLALIGATARVNTGGAGTGGLEIVTDQNSNAGMAISPTSNVGGGSYIQFTNAAGSTQGSISATNSTTTAYNTSSDRRLKNDLGLATTVDVLRATRVHDGSWKSDGSLDRFVFAQEALTVKPRAVTIGTDAVDAKGRLTRPWMVDYSKYVPDLIVGWQQHDNYLYGARGVEARLAALEDKT